MDAAEDSVLSDILAPTGRTNFSQDCTVDGGAARLAMNEREVLLAVAGGDRGVLRAEFAQAAIDGDGLARQVRLGTDITVVSFDSDHSAQRVARVLGVRTEGANRSGDRGSGPYGSGLGAGPPAPTAAYRTGNAGTHASPSRLYRQWMEYTLLTSTLLLVVAWLDLVGGVILTFVLLANGSGAAGLLWLLVTAAGCAMPLCLASLARMIVFRWRAQDEQG